MVAQQLLRSCSALGVLHYLSLHGQYHNLLECSSSVIPICNFSGVLQKILSEIPLISGCEVCNNLLLLRDQALVCQSRVHVNSCFEMLDVERGHKWFPEARRSHTAEVERCAAPLTRHTLQSWNRAMLFKFTAIRRVIALSDGTHSLLSFGFFPLKLSHALSKDRPWPFQSHPPLAV